MVNPENNNPEEIPEQALTSIHGAYTLSNTNQDAGEVDKLIVNQFLRTLAEVAMAVASRKKSTPEEINR